MVSVSMTVDRKLKGLDAAQAMVGELFALSRCSLGFEVGRMTVESQQLYPNRDDTRQSLVGKGNDLIMLATITGAAAALFGGKVLLPRQWKQQKKKEIMHSRARELWADQGTVGKSFEMTGGSLSEGKALHAWDHSMDIHCMDALCMAMTLAGFRV
ncbi:MAG: hypothetical protein GF414_04455 [Candidatus Altiarchaeales archaeon]|nr:hypothetical protein [Candidatus Altiarchaeales archaeon]